LTPCFSFREESVLSNPPRFFPACFLPREISLDSFIYSSPYQLFFFLSRFRHFPQLFLQPIAAFLHSFTFPSFCCAPLTLSSKSPFLQRFFYSFEDFLLLLFPQLRFFSCPFRFTAFFSHKFHWSPPSRFFSSIFPLFPATPSLRVLFPRRNF